jgi:succinate dehydrogenase / fumarate reductase iron-sulfur subunit
MSLVEGGIPTPPEKVIFKIKRFDPEKQEFYWKEYEITTYRGMTVLDALLKIKEEQDSSLAFRYSCRMGICGSCGMVINGMPRLACQTQVGAIATEGNPVITVEPLYNYPPIRDLFTDFTSFFEKHKSVKPYLIRKDPQETETGDAEFAMTPEEYEDIYQFSLCISCGVCYAACPVAASDPLYLGPQALAYAWRYVSDVRDEGYEERLKIVDTEHGCHRCHFAASCSAVCPKVVDPAMGIQKLRSALYKKKLGLWKKKTSKKVGPYHYEGPSRAKKVPYLTEALLPGVDLEAKMKEPVNIDIELE